MRLRQALGSQKNLALAVGYGGGYRLIQMAAGDQKSFLFAARMIPGSSKSYPDCQGAKLADWKLIVLPTPGSVAVETSKPEWMWSQG